MNIHQPPTRDMEEEWIVKYRAALNAAPIEQSCVERVRAALTNVCSLVVSYSATVVDKWIDWQSPITNPDVQSKLSHSARFRVPYRRSDGSPAKDESVYKKAS